MEEEGERDLGHVGMPPCSGETGGMMPHLEPCHTYPSGDAVNSKKGRKRKEKWKIKGRKDKKKDSSDILC